MWPPSDIPFPGTIFIDVWNMRAVVSKYVRTGEEKSFTWVPASNAEELEEDASRVVSEQGGAINLSGHYLCPEELAARALWPADAGEEVDPWNR